MMRVIYGMIGGLLTGAVLWFLETRWQRANPVTPDIVTCTMKPGKTTLRMVDDKEVVRAVLILKQVTQRFNGPATAEFTDFTPYISDRTLEQDHALNCNKGWHTKAEGCGP